MRKARTRLATSWFTPNYFDMFGSFFISYFQRRFVSKEIVVGISNDVSSERVEVDPTNHVFLLSLSLFYHISFPGARNIDIMNWTTPPVCILCAREIETTPSSFAVVADRLIAWHFCRPTILFSPPPPRSKRTSSNYFMDCFQDIGNLRNRL